MSDAFTSVWVVVYKREERLGSGETHRTIGIRQKQAPHGDIMRIIVEPEVFAGLQLGEEMTITHITRRTEAT